MSSHVSGGGEWEVTQGGHGMSSHVSEGWSGEEGLNFAPPL